MKLVNVHDLVQAILKERETIRLRVPCAPYELMDDKPSTFGQGQRSGIRKALRCINEAPAADAEEVVRCKDCKRLVEFRKSVKQAENAEGICHIRAMYSTDKQYQCVSANDFCSMGERIEK